MQNNRIVFFQKPKSAEIKVEPLVPLQHDEVRIRTHYTMISTGTEMTAYNGDFPAGSVWEKFFACPYFPGYNNVGTIVEIGSGVDPEWLHRRVVSSGGHAEFVTVRIVAGANGTMDQAKGAADVIPVPPEIDDCAAVFFTIPKIVSNAVRLSRLQWGESVAVFGLGLLGQFAVRFCRTLGCTRVFAVDTSDERLKFLPQEFGIIPVNPRKQPDYAETIFADNHGRKLDAVFEVTGNAALLKDQAKLLRTLGRLVILSSPQRPVEFDFHDYCVWNSIEIIGAHNFSHPACEQSNNPWTMTRHVELYFDLLADGRMDIKPLISRIVDYTEAGKVYADLSANRSTDMGILFKWPGAPEKE